MLRWEQAEMFFEAAGAILLGILAISDLRVRKVPVLPVIIFGSAAAFVRGLDLIGQTAAGMLPGLVLLAAGLVLRGRIGTGDGIVLLFIGGMLGGAQSAGVLFVSLFLVSLFSAVGLLCGKLHKDTGLPFIPFYLAAYLGVIYL